MLGGDPVGVRVTAASRPAQSLSLPPVDKETVDLALVPSEEPNLVSEVDRGFAAARGAFWNREAAAGERILRGILPKAKSEGDAWHLKRLIADGYAENGEWDEALARMEEFGLAERDRDRYRIVRQMAGLPRTGIGFEEGTGAVPFELRLGQLVLAKARVNGCEARAFIDTGFSMTYVTDRFARRAGLGSLAWTVPVTDSNGESRPLNRATIQRLELGCLRATNLVAVCGTDRKLAGILGEVDIVVGWDVLRHADVSWDFPSRRMEVTAPGGPEASAPSLSGRQAPLLRVCSAEGRDLELFLDTGFAPIPVGVELVQNSGLLLSKTEAGKARRGWRPTLRKGFNSFRIRWPRRIRPFSFWMDGTLFEVPQATVSPRIDVREGMQTCDGTIGNAPFLGGCLRVCGARRLASFTVSSPPQTPGASSGVDPHNGGSPPQGAGTR
jgi:hypothetical protein